MYDRNFIFTTLWANSAVEINIFSYFSQKTGFNISCKLSSVETICMKCQILFSGKNKKKKKYFTMSSAENFTGMLRVKLSDEQYIEVQTRQAPDVNITSPQRRCNVMTLHRRWGDVIFTLHRRWGDVIFTSGMTLHRRWGDVIFTSGARWEYGNKGTD